MRGHYKTLFRELLTAILIYPILEKKVLEAMQEGEHKIHLGIISDMSRTLTHDLLCESFKHFPKKLRHGAQFICMMQYRLTPLDKRKHPPKRIVKHKEFIHPLTFLKLRSLIYPELFKSYEYWKNLWKNEES